MKTILSLITAILLGNLLAAQTTAIPDRGFEMALIDLGYDTGTPNGSVPTANIDTVTTLEVLGFGIGSLVGIEDFLALDSLTVYFTSVKSLDLSANTALRYLDCVEGQMTTLNVSKNTALTILDCSENQITTLDVSNCTSLKVLNCDENRITNLDVSNNIALIELSFNGNLISSIDVTKHIALKHFDCGYNQLDSLDVTQNIALNNLGCGGNKLTNLDVTKNIGLTVLTCDDNPLIAIDLTQNTALTRLYCDGIQLTNIELTKNTALKELRCNDNRLTRLDLTKNTALGILYCNENQLTSLDLSKNTGLWLLYCNNNQLTSLNVKNGNNHNSVANFEAKNNPDLKCIDVDDVAHSTTFWTNIDPGVKFSTNCSGSGTSGLQGNEPIEGFSLYPNPTTGTIYIDLEENSTLLKTTLRNTIGQVISTQEFENTNNISLDIDAPAGIYFLTLESSTGISRTEKIIRE